MQTGALRSWRSVARIAAFWTRSWPRLAVAPMMWWTQMNTGSRCSPENWKAARCFGYISRAGLSCKCGQKRTWDSAWASSNTSILKKPEKPFRRILMFFGQAASRSFHSRRRHCSIASRESSSNCSGSAELAECLHFGFVRQVGDNGFVGLQAPQNVRPHELAQRAVGIVRPVGKAFDEVSELLRRSQQPRGDEGENGPEIPEAVLDGRAGERE